MHTCMYMSTHHTEVNIPILWLSCLHIYKPSGCGKYFTAQLLEQAQRRAYLGQSSQLTERLTERI